MSGTDIHNSSKVTFINITQYTMHNVMETCFVSPQFKKSKSLQDINSELRHELRPLRYKLRIMIKQNYEIYIQNYEI